MNGRSTADYGTAARYSVSEAARILRIEPTALRRWCRGQSYRGARSDQPLLIRPDGENAGDTYLSFFNLIEAGFIRAYREPGAPMQRIRAALDFCRDRLSTPRPLLTERFRVDGKDLVLEFDRGLLSAGASGRYHWPDLVERWLSSIDFDRVGPLQLWIAGRENSIVVNPRIGFGLPVLASCGVRTEEVVARLHAGEGPREIAEDLSTNDEEIAQALRWETTLRDS